jgi:hypothetical protein
MLQRQPGGRHGAKPLAVPAHGAGLKRHAHERSSAHLSGSPPKKENEVMQAKHQRQRAAKQAASASTTTAGGKGSGSGSDSEMSSAPQQRKARSAKGGAAPQAQAPQQPQGKKQGKQAAAAAAATADMRQLAAASSAAGAALHTPGSGKGAGKGLPLKFAGPAFTNSPMPDSLPIPTPSLLLQVGGCWAAAGVAAAHRAAPLGALRQQGRGTALAARLLPCCTADLLSPSIINCVPSRYLAAGGCRGSALPPDPVSSGVPHSTTHRVAPLSCGRAGATSSRP